MNTQSAVRRGGDRTRSYFGIHQEAPRRRWWRPLSEAGLMLVVFLALLAGLMVAAVVVSFIPVSSFPDLAAGIDAAFASSDVDLTDPVAFVLVNVMLILLIPAVLIGMRLAGGRPAGTLLSVTGRLRWGRFWRATLVAVPLYVVFLSVTFALDPPVEFAFDARAWLLLGLVLLLTPLQAAAEEVVFRGLLGQMVGAWLRHPLWAVLLPLPLFVICHDYNARGLLDVGVFALCAGVLAWRTGGLEAPIALHVVNNVSVLALGAVGLIDVNAASDTWLVTLAGCALTVLVTATILRVEARTCAVPQAAPITSEVEEESQLLPV